ncbi:hypothetical protein [Tepidibacillus fermentans]|uniref:Uncharacterized protein n=1 Tax=Tepidibacillus fermentans TaxID=1281767 RepID=A0A4R3KLV3_9BACI|nr:hypothetical protein [Tepidibacillus fermentans]TCS84582.1 hypothetical protein EDD72_101251 [Tepidibacillus fermentans]
MAYLVYGLFLVLLVVDNPFKKIHIQSNLKKILDWSLLISALIHGFVEWRTLEPFSFSPAFISGVLFYGLIFTFIGAGENKGIEDKAARKIFKRMSWVLLFFISLFHVFKVL